MKETPLVSVLMPVYNSQAFLREAIDSILNQTFTDFEFLIFNDGSTDKSLDIIQSYSDQRIKLISYSENAGYVRALNEGLKIANGKYIARMDADDVALPERLEKQVAFLEKNLGYAVCGSWAEFTTLGLAAMPTEDEDLRIQLLHSTPFNHPTTMIRKSSIDNGNIQYRHSLVPIEDYYFFFQVSKQGRMTILPQVLMKYRLHSASISFRQLKKQHENRKVIQKLVIKDFIPDLTEFELEIYLNLHYRQNNLTPEFIGQSRILIERIIAQNIKLKWFNQEKLESYFARLWKELFINSKVFSVSLLSEYRKAKFRTQNPFTINQFLRFYFKCLINFEIKEVSK